MPTSSKMVTVAVAGGTGNLGKTIVDALKASSKYNAIVLSRKPVEVEDPEAPTSVVDYGDVEGLIALFEEHEVHIVISTITLHTPESGAAEVALVKAAKSSGTVKRFIASDWSFPTPEESAQTSMLQHRNRKTTQAELEKTNIEWTRFYIGALMEYWGPASLESHMRPLNICVNIEKRIAGLPGDGSGVTAFTYSKDVAKMTVAHLDAPKWEENTYAFTEQMSFKDLVLMAEDILGVKFDVSYDSKEKLEKGDYTNVSEYPLPPQLKPAMAQYSKWMMEGWAQLPEEKNIKNNYTGLSFLSLRETVELWVKQ